jgi:hypothetical protein
MFKIPEPQSPAAQWSLRIAGYLVGAVIAYFICYWLWCRAFYGPCIAGLTVGYGGVLLYRRGSVTSGIMAAVITLLAMVIEEAIYAPVYGHPGVAYFVTHFFGFGDWLVKLLLYALGVAVAYYIAKKG